MSDPAPPPPDPTQSYDPGPPAPSYDPGAPAYAPGPPTPSYDPGQQWGDQTPGGGHAFPPPASAPPAGPAQASTPPAPPAAGPYPPALTGQPYPAPQPGAWPGTPGATGPLGMPGHPAASGAPAWPGAPTWPGTPGTPAGPGYPPGYPAGPGWPSTPAPPAKKSRGGVIVAVIAALVVLLCAGVVTGAVVLISKARVAVENADPVPAAPELPDGSAPGETVTVVYEVNGEGEVTSLSYTAEDGMPKRLENVELPWRVEVKLPKSSLYTVFAVRSSQSGGSGELSCRLTVDGEEEATRESSGPVALVTCTAFDQD